MMRANESSHVQRAYDQLERITSAEFHSMRKDTGQRVNEAKAALSLALAQERPEGWMPARFDILTLQNERREVFGMKLAESFLGVHLSENGSVHASVTHIPSGKRLGAFRSLGAAMTFCEDIAPHYQWSNPTVDEMPESIKRLIASIAHVHA